MRDKQVKACFRCNGICFNCHYADECDTWLDNGGDYIPTVPVMTARMSLCEGRHNIPQAEDGSIFGKDLNPLDVSGMEVKAKIKLAKANPQHLDLYVTGLTVALIAVLNAARSLGIGVTLYHYDRESGDYYPQEVC